MLHNVFCGVFGFRYFVYSSRDIKRLSYIYSSLSSLFGFLIIFVSYVTSFIVGLGGPSDNKIFTINTYLTHTFGKHLILQKTVE